MSTSYLITPRPPLCLDGRGYINTFIPKTQLKGGKLNGPRTIYERKGAIPALFSLGNKVLTNSLKSLGEYFIPNCLGSKDSFVAHLSFSVLRWLSARLLIPRCLG